MNELEKVLKGHIYKECIEFIKSVKETRYRKK